MDNTRDPDTDGVGSPDPVGSENRGTGASDTDTVESEERTSGDDDHDGLSLRPANLAVATSCRSAEFSDPSVSRLHP